jgi:hypothetical protein
MHDAAGWFVLLEAAALSFQIVNKFMSHSNNPKLTEITEKDIKQIEMTYPVTQMETLTLVSPHPSKVSSLIWFTNLVFITIDISSSQVLDEDTKVNEISNSTPEKVQE